MVTLSMKLPDVGEGVTEAELVEWHVKVGDVIREDDILAAVMTDKATVEIPSVHSGRITWMAGDIGDIIAVGSDLALIETDGPAAAETSPAAEPVAAETATEESSGPTAPEPVAASPGDAASPEPESLRALPVGTAPLASPAVRASARDRDIDLYRVRGSGPAGRISLADLDEAANGRQDYGSTPRRMQRQGETKVNIVGMRRKIAERMSIANSRIPHITVVEEIDATSMEELRAKLNAARGDKPKLTILPFVVAALTKAFVDHPEMNARFDDEAGVVTRFAPAHLGIATMTEAGLVVPVLRHAEALGLFDVASEIARLSDAARQGKATRDELTGSTFTITSLGPLGAIATTPIINHPEVAILGINKMAIRPMWDGSQFVPRRMMNISASFDHRVIDGWDAAVFVQRIKSLLESPALIFVED